MKEKVILITKQIDDIVMCQINGRPPHPRYIYPLPPSQYLCQLLSFGEGSTCETDNRKLIIWTKISQKAQDNHILSHSDLVRRKQRNE